MRTTTLPRQMPETYDDLVRLHVPRPIHDDLELENTRQVVNRLAVLDRRTADQEDYLDLLSNIMESYEGEHHEIEPHGSGTLAILEFLLNEAGMTASDLGRLLGSRELGPEVLRGERQLTKAHVKTLADHFHVDARLFLD